MLGQAAAITSMFSLLKERVHNLEHVCGVGVGRAACLPTSPISNFYILIITSIGISGITIITANFATLLLYLWTQLP